MRDWITSSAFVKGFLGAVAAALLLAVVWLAYVHLQQHAAMWAWINAREAERQQAARPTLPTAPPAAATGT